MIIVGWIVKIMLALGMIGFIVIIFKAMGELWTPPKSNQINIKINFWEKDSESDKKEKH